jgi:hypothetical protein
MCRGYSAWMRSGRYEHRGGRLTGPAIELARAGVMPRATSRVPGSHPPPLDRGSGQTAEGRCDHLDLISAPVMLVAGGTRAWAAADLPLEMGANHAASRAGRRGALGARTRPRARRSDARVPRLGAGLTAGAPGWSARVMTRGDARSDRFTRLGGTGDICVSASSRSGDDCDDRASVRKAVIRLANRALALRTRAARLAGIS